MEIERSGDLNRDGVEDLLLVLRMTDRRNVVTNGKATTRDRPPPRAFQRGENCLDGRSLPEGEFFAPGEETHG